MVIIMNESIYLSGGNLSQEEFIDSWQLLREYLNENLIADNFICICCTVNEYTSFYKVPEKIPSYIDWIRIFDSDYDILIREDCKKIYWRIISSKSIDNSKFPLKSKEINEKKDYIVKEEKFHLMTKTSKNIPILPLKTNSRGQLKVKLYYEKSQIQFIRYVEVE